MTKNSKKSARVKICLLEGVFDTNKYVLHRHCFYAVQSGGEYTAIVFVFNRRTRSNESAKSFLSNILVVVKSIARTREELKTGDTGRAPADIFVREAKDKGI